MEIDLDDAIGSAKDGRETFPIRMKGDKFSSKMRKFLEENSIGDYAVDYMKKIIHFMEESDAMVAAMLMDTEL